MAKHTMQVTITYYTPKEKHLSHCLWGKNRKILLLNPSCLHAWATADHLDTCWTGEKDRALLQTGHFSYHAITHENCPATGLPPFPPFLLPSCLILDFPFPKTCHLPTGGNCACLPRHSSQHAPFTCHHSHYPGIPMQNPT